MNSFDFGRAFKAPFDDPDWVKKTLFGWLWGVLIVTSPAVTGAMLDYIKSVAHGNERLPEWDNFGDKWVRGFMVYVAAFIYFLPVWVLGAIFLVPVVLAGSSNSNALGALASGGLCLFGLVAIVYSLAVAVIFYAAVVNYAITGEFAAFFRFGDHIARIRANAGYWSAFGAAIVASFAAGIVAGVIPIVGTILSFALSYLAYMVAGHAFGQWAAGSYNLPGLAAAGIAVGYPPAPTPGTYGPPAPPAYAPPPPPAYSPPAAPFAPPAPAAPVAPFAPPAPAAPTAPAYGPAAPEAPAPPAYQPAAPPVAPDAAFQPPAAPEPPAPASEPTSPAEPFTSSEPQPPTEPPVS